MFTLQNESTELNIQFEKGMLSRRILTGRIGFVNDTRSDFSVYGFYTVIESV